VSVRVRITLARAGVLGVVSADLEVNARPRVTPASVLVISIRMLASPSSFSSSYS
jgi:hypothetical protein